MSFCFVSFLNMTTRKLEFYIFGSQYFSLATFDQGARVLCFVFWEKVSLWSPELPWATSNHPDPAYRALSIQEGKYESQHLGSRISLGWCCASLSQKAELPSWMSCLGIVCFLYIVLGFLQRILISQRISDFTKAVFTFIPIFCLLLYPDSSFYKFPPSLVTFLLL